MKPIKFTPIRNILVAILITTLPALAQVNYKLAPNPDLKISGTSTIHDWDMVSSTATGEGKFTLENGKIKSSENVSIIMPAESIKSGKSGMDKNAYVALKSKNNKEVRFDLKEINPKGSSYEATGDFTIAGTKKTVKFPVNISEKNKILNVTGFYPFKLTDFNIDPPTALLGTVKTGNEVSIHFDLNFQPIK